MDDDNEKIMAALEADPALAVLLGRLIADPARIQMIERLIADPEMLEAVLELVKIVRSDGAALRRVDDVEMAVVKATDRIAGAVVQAATSAPVESPAAARSSRKKDSPAPKSRRSGPRKAGHK